MTPLTSNRQSFYLKEINDADINYVEKILGVEFDAPRRGILKCHDSVDVQACPGSGKTTLLVAKLALLAASWSSSRKGICVLSHTNVARLEIERKLSNTIAGSRLLTYPHYIGTIHGFINEHIAVPWLKSLGKHVEHIDNEACADRCKFLLSNTAKYYIARAFLTRNDANSPDRTIRSLAWRWETSEVKLSSSAKKTGKLPCGEGSDTYKQLLEIKQRVSEDGYYMHDDMFALAEQAIAQNSQLISFIRSRFPIVFIDEMQDTNQFQIAFLYKIFPPAACHLRQRFGDGNQAIYEDRTFDSVSDETEDTQSQFDIFPQIDEGKRRDLPNSLRFTQWIADRAAPIAPDPQKLVGGANHTSGITNLAHTIFIYEPDQAQKVLPTYGEILLDIFSNDLLKQGRFRAVGRIQSSNSKDEFKPRALLDYWPDYQKTTGSTGPQLKTLIDYVCLSQLHRRETNECSVAVDFAIKGILKLISLAGTDVRAWKPSPRMVFTERLIADKANFLKYQKLIWKWCVACQELSEHAWTQDTNKLVKVLTALGITININLPAIAAYLNYVPDSISPSRIHTSTQNLGFNTYRHVRANQVVDIKLSSIHAAKGETHTATLVLETYYRDLDLKTILPWLVGRRRGGTITTQSNKGKVTVKPVGKLLLERLKAFYVAMTRPTHLLCLAMRRSSLGEDGAAIDGSIAALSALGWRVIHIQ